MFSGRGSLKLKLGLGAALLGLVALLATGMSIYSSDRLSARIDATIAAERRLDRYAVLSTQISSFIVVAAEAIQAGLPPARRAERLEGLSQNIRETFARIRSDLETAVDEARDLGLDEQSRRATQSIGIARMEATFETTRRGLISDTEDREHLIGFIDIFSIGFDPLLNAVITDEVRARDAIIASVASLRRSLIYTAIVISLVTVALLAAFYLGLIRPQFRRLDMLLDAADQIKREEFSITLPETQSDEIGRIFARTNRMAQALAQRRDQVERDWARLNETIAERTEELRNANDALARTDEDRRRFFADISHELRTPLTVILMEAQLGLKGSPNPDQSFEIIHKRAERLSRRIDDLLRIARSETGQLALDAQSFDLCETVQMAVSDIRSELDNAGMEVTCQTAGPLLVTGDCNWVRQVLTGLIQNAIRHARSGGALALICRQTGEAGCVSVIDNGPGIAPADQARIFERFQQGHGPQKSEGFGIGLALAKWVVEQQGGRISITSPLERDDQSDGPSGTKVTLCIPRAAD